MNTLNYKAFILTLENKELSSIKNHDDTKYPPLTFYSAGFVTQKHTGRCRHWPGGYFIFCTTFSTASQSSLGQIVDGAAAYSYPAGWRSGRRLLLCSNPLRFPGRMAEDTFYRSGHIRLYHCHLDGYHFRPGRYHVALGIS